MRTTWMSLAELRAAHPPPEEFDILQFTLVGKLDGKANQLVWVHAILERTAVIQWGPDRELVKLERVRIDKNDAPRTYVLSFDPFTGLSIDRHESRARGRETQRKMREAKRAAQAQVEVAACG